MLKWHRFGTIFAVAALGCSAAEDEMTRAEFCDAWASDVCNAEVVSVCQADDATACQDSQRAACLEQVPEPFSAKTADACLSAVKAAYTDLDLTRAELDTVFNLAAPCNELVLGPKLSGQSCTADADCDTPGGYRCVIKGGQTDGTCQVPETVGAGLACDAPEQVCDAGFFCNGDNCIAGYDLGEACVNSSECGEAGYCEGDLCVARLALNEECTRDEQCESLICYDSGAAQRCVDRIRLSPAEPLCEQLR